MRKLTHISVIDADMSPSTILALDDNGELWFGKMETTDDGRKVIDWSPVNTPRDGAGFTEPQQNFFDKWEQEARDRIKRDTETRRTALSLETEGTDDASATGEQAEDSSDHSVEDGEGADSDLGPGGESSQ